MSMQHLGFLENNKQNDMKQEIRLPKGYELKELEKGVYEIVKSEFKLENGKDYIRVDGDFLIINRKGERDNSGFDNEGDYYKTGLHCATPNVWREATNEEVFGFFEKHLVERYGEDWRNVKIKDAIYGHNDQINNGEKNFDINKYNGTWWVWNNNGCLFHKGKWAEVLEENKLEVGKDYIRRNDPNVIVIDRKNDFDNNGFYSGLGFSSMNIACSNAKLWREATESEVIEAFEKELVKRYGENWKDVKVKECVQSGSTFNNNSLSVVIVKVIDKGWVVWNSNNCLYYKGKWAEPLEEVPIIELRGLDKKWQWCAMDGDRKVLIFESKPKKHNAFSWWYDPNGNALNCKHLDQSQFTELKKLNWKDSLHKIKHV